MLLPLHLCRVPQLQRIALLTFILTLGWSSSSWACDWSSRDIAYRFEAATDVFIARVIESPWVSPGPVAAARAKPGAVSPDVKLAVETRYKRTDFREVTVTWAGDCTFPFLEGERYVVFGAVRDGQFFASRAEEPLLMGDGADAYTRQQTALAVQYAEARAGGRPVTLVYGRVEIADKEGGIAGVKVRAEAPASGGWAALTSLGPGPYSYGLVVPPGDYSLWIERDGVRVSPVWEARLPVRQGVQADFTGAWRAGEPTK
jgi:hypothetical protein